MRQLGFKVLALAIVEWTGWGRAGKPVRDETVLVDRFGEVLALELVPMVRAIVDDFYKSDAYNTVSDLDEMGEQAAHEFRLRHPELPLDVAQALAWCYTFDWK